VETVVAHSMDVVLKGILIGFVTNLGSGLGGVLIGRNLNWSLALPIITTKVVGTLQMVFTNPILTTHVNKNYRSTIDELNGYWRVQKCKYNKLKNTILKTICCNYTKFFIIDMAILLGQTW